MALMEADVALSMEHGSGIATGGRSKWDWARRPGCGGVR